MPCEDVADALNEGFGVELRADDLVRAVGEDGDAPVADEGYELIGVGGFDLGAEGLGDMDAGLAFYVDEDEVVWAAIENYDRLGVAQGGVDIVAIEAEDLIA